MSWQTDLFCTITFLGETYDRKSTVEDELMGKKRAIRIVEQRLRDFALMTEPEKFYDKESYESPYDFIDRELRDNFEMLQELHEEAYKLQLLLDNWELCHDKDGYPVTPPWGWEDRAYIEGDYIKKREEATE